MKKLVSLLSVLTALSMLSGCGESVLVSAPEESGVIEDNSNPVGGSDKDEENHISEKEDEQQKQDGDTSVAEKEEQENSSAEKDEYAKSESKGEPDPVELPIDIYCPDGERIYSEDISKIYANEELSAAQLTEDNWYQIECEGFTYLAENSGIQYNSKDDADKYDAENYEFEGVTGIVPAEYKRYKVGDKIGDLTVTYAVTDFSSQNADAYYCVGDDEWLSAKELGMKHMYLNGGVVEFDGSVTLTGYANKAPEDDGYIAKCDIGFFPDKESCILPVMNYAVTPEGVNTRVWTYNDIDTAWASEYTDFEIGNTEEERYSDFDFSGLPDDGSYVKVRVTLEDITMKCRIDWISNINAKITAFEVIG